MNEVNPAAFAALVIFSIACYWATRIVYGFRRTEDHVRDGLAIGSLLMFVFSMGFLLVSLIQLAAIPYIFMGLIAVGIMIYAYNESERKAFLWTLMHAVDRGVPLATIAESFEWNRPRSRKRKRLTELLRQGASIRDALRTVRFSLSTDALLAIELSGITSNLSDAFRKFITSVEETNRIISGLLIRGFYFTWLIFYGTAITLFIFWKIVPVYEKMFVEFELELPRQTTFLISVVSSTRPFLTALGFPLGLFLLLVMFLSILYATGWLPRDVPLVSRMGYLLDRSRVLRGLSVAIKASSSLDKALAYLAEVYPKRYIRRRLQRVGRQVHEGEDWTAAMRGCGLIGKADAAILRSAQRVGNLTWALDEMADSNARRFIHWVRWLQSILIPLFTLIFGLIVSYIMIGLFMPLVSLIQGLT